MDKKNVINFAPRSEKRKHGVPRYVTITIICCLLAFAVSAFVILAINDFDLGRALGAREPSTQLSDETTAENGDDVSADESELSEALTFLLLCSDSQELTFCQLVSVDTAGRKIRIKPIPLDYTLKPQSGEITVAEAFVKESLSVFAASFSTRNIHIKRYVHITEDNFKRFMSLLGPVPVTVTGNYEISIDAVRYTFAPGVQNMTSDILLKYMKFAEEGEAALRIQGDAVGAVFRQHFTAENLGKGEDFFSSLINLVDTNITAFDYTGAQDALSRLLSGDVTVAVVS